MGKKQISYPNQYNTTIHKEKCDKDNLYAVINLDALQNAMNCLSGSALTLWLYLAKNQESYNLWLSKTAIIEWGLPERSYYRARDELRDKGFLVESSTNHFDFYEYPPDQNESAKMAEISAKMAQKNDTAKMALKKCQNGRDQCQNGRENCQNGYRNTTYITDNTVDNTVEATSKTQLLAEQPRKEITQKELEAIPKDKYEWLNENTIKAKRTGYIFTIID